MTANTKHKQTPPWQEAKKLDLVRLCKHNFFDSPVHYHDFSIILHPDCVFCQL